MDLNFYLIESGQTKWIQTFITSVGVTDWVNTFNTLPAGTYQLYNAHDHTKVGSDIVKA